MKTLLTNTSTAILAFSAVAAIAILAGLGHPIPASLTTLAGTLAGGHLMLKVPGIGTVTLAPPAVASPVKTTPVTTGAPTTSGAVAS